jgi:hypothetical protein
MSKFPGWLNGSYTLASTPAACQRLQNLYAEVMEVEGEKSVGLLKGCPGLATALLTLPKSPLRALLAAGTPLYPLSGTAGRLFAVAGDSLYEVFADGTYTDRSALGAPATTVGNDGKPAILIPNGNQLAVISAGQFYIDNGAGPYQPLRMPASGDCNTIALSGTCTVTNGAVARVAGDFFNGIQFFDLITINGTARSVSFIGAGALLSTLQISENVTTGVVAWTCYAANVTLGSSGTLTGFPATLTVGSTITINAVAYRVSKLPYAGGVASNSRVNLTASPGNQSDVPWLVSVLNAVVNCSGGAPNTLTWVSGDPFPLYGLIGAQVYLNGGAVGAPNSNVVLSPTSMTLSAGAALANASFSVNPLLVASTGAYLDNFFVISPPSSRFIQVSAAGDGTSWDGLDEAAKESYPDNIGKLLAMHEQLYVFGESSTEVWRAPGSDPNFPFQRDPGACMSVGIAAPESAATGPQGPCWIGSGLEGGPIAYYAQGSIPTRISTHAIEQAWSKYSTVADAEAFTFKLDGHYFWQIGFPTADATWLYDFTASAQMGKPMWAERNSYDGAAFHRHRARCHAYVWGKHLVGDFSNGKIYEMTDTVFTDAGQPITCIRTLPHLCAERLRQFFQKLQIDMATGGVAFTVKVEWSDDGGTTFVGGTGQFLVTTSTTDNIARLAFFGLGSSEDRVFRITVTGNGRKALINAYLDVLTGIS